MIRIFGKTNKSHSTAEIQPELEKFAQQMHLVLTRSVESLLVSLKYDLSYKKGANLRIDKNENQILSSIITLSTV